MRSVGVYKIALKDHPIKAVPPSITHVPYWYCLGGIALTPHSDTAASFRTVPHLPHMEADIRKDVVRFLACCDTLLHSTEMQQPLSEKERDLVRQYVARISEKLNLNATTLLIHGSRNHSGQ